MNHSIEIALHEPQFAAVIRERVRYSELPKFVPAACGEVWSFIRSAGLVRPGRHVAVYGASAEGRVDVEVGAEVGEQFVGNARVQCSQLPTGPAAHGIHWGSYSLLKETHAAIRKWCETQGHRLTGISWEVYDHWQEGWNAYPSKIRTEVFYQLGNPDVLGLTQG